MITFKLHIKSSSNPQFIENKQLMYSFAFRKLYRNNHILTDINYLNNLKSEYNLNDIELRSLISEVKSKLSQISTNKSKLEAEINDINENILDLSNYPKSIKNTRLLFKLKRKSQYKSKLLSKDIVFGGKSLLRKLTYLSNDKANNEECVLITKSKYTANRMLPIFILGEANQKANRFFSFDLLNNTLTYKPAKGIKINIEYSCYHSYKSILSKLQSYIDNKLIAVSIRLSTDYIYLIFDDEQLNGYSLNTVERAKEVKLIKDTVFNKETKSILIKETYKKHYKEQEERKLLNKLSYRYLAIDTNPDYIGCSILDKIGDEIKIIHTFNYDLSELNNKLPKEYSIEYRIHINNKRKHGIFHIWKDIFESFNYYKCGYLVLEDLNISNKDLGNKVANRKINNVWYRDLSTNIIQKYCNRYGIQKVEINPCYSSFIGNLTYTYVDPVNASIEIGRRGMFKYVKNKFYPEIETGTILDTMSRINGVDLRDVLDIKDCGSWVEVYRKIRESGLRYRANLEDCKGRYRLVDNIVHSKIRKEVFSLENNVELLKLS